MLRSCLGEDWVAATTAELWSCGMAQSSRLTSIASRMRRLGSRTVRTQLGLPPRRFAPDRPDRYDAEFERLGTPCYLIGYFQNAAYWNDVVDGMAVEVATRLGLTPDPAGPPVVGIHLRRDTYLDEGWALPAAYYRQAVEVVSAHLRGAGPHSAPTWRVVGDDPTFVAAFADQLSGDGHEVEPVPRSGDRPDPLDALDDLRRLARCDHLIISNSSFAWWAAALGDVGHAGRGRLVTVPDRWVDGVAPESLRRTAWTVVEAPDDGLSAVPGSFGPWWAAAEHVSPP